MRVLVNILKILLIEKYIVQTLLPPFPLLSYKKLKVYVTQIKKNISYSDVETRKSGYNYLLLFPPTGDEQFMYFFTWIHKKE